MDNLIIALIFYFLGRYSRTDEIELEIEKIKHKIKRKPKPGVLKFKHPEDFTEEAIQDKKLEDEWIKSGKARSIQQ